MDEKEQNTVEELMQDNLQEEYMKSFDSLKEGQMIDGQVVEISDEYVFIDIGYKSEGKIAKDEFTKLPNTGETVKVVLIKKEGKYGQVVVSKKRADEKLFWIHLEKCFKDRIPVDAVIAKKVKGGFEAQINGLVKGFIPLSKVDLNKLEKEKNYLGLHSKFYIEGLSSGRNRNIVLSRKSWLEEEVKRQQQEFFTTKKAGDIVEGTAKSFTSFGVFIDLGGFDGLLHNNELSWSKVNKAKDFVNKGEKIQVKIAQIDKEAKKINLSLKDLTENPWHTFEKKYNIGDKVTGKVTKLVDFGAFIELEKGIEGLVHVSELSWVKRVRHPKEILKTGDVVEIKILGYDLDNKKISLSLKHLLPNPWDDIDVRYPVGSRIKRTVKNLANTGAFLEIEEGIDGFLQVNDISWIKKIKEPSEALKPGNEVEVMIISIDKENKKLRLGIKQLGKDPWTALAEVFHKGTIIEGEIIDVSTKGITIRVQGGIESFIKKSNICDFTLDNVDEVLKKYKAGDVIKSIILELNPKRQYLSLSLKNYDKQIRNEEMEKYLHDEENPVDKVTLADMIKGKKTK